jgi:DNA-binding transcriptional MerR regulator
MAEAGARARKGGGGRERPGLAMRELSRATGLPRSTLLHYLAERLLPPPVRTSRNMAWYDPSCVDRVKLIRQLQRNHRLALHEIRAMLERGEPAALAARLALNQAVFGAEEGPVLRLRAFCAETGLSPAAVGELVRADLFSPLESGAFDRADVAAGRAYARGLGFGLRPADMAFYARGAEAIGDGEVALRARLNADLPDADDAARTLEMVGNARAIRGYVLERTFQKRIGAMRSLKEGRGRGRPARRKP